MKQYFLFLIAACLLISCNEGDEPGGDDGQAKEETIPFLEYTYHQAYPHDTTSFTEGLLVHDNNLYESTGAPDDMPQTRSVAGIVDTKTGKIDVKVELDRGTYFGEGITILNDKLYYLTYRSRVGFIYDLKTFRKTGEFVMPAREGWGMTTDSASLIMSEGSHRLIYIDPATMQSTKILEVRDDYGNVSNLNELEYIRGYIYANQYGTNLVLKIDPASGRVVGRFDFSRLANQARAAYAGSLEMNGIAYDPQKDRMLLTGKMWPFIFEVSVAL